MTRKKVNLDYISNDSARKATFKKRKKGLIKKVNELTTLCGIDACAIIYSPYGTEPEVFPSPLGVQQVLTRFRRMPKIEQSKKMVNQESFLQQQIDKATEQLRKQRSDNREKEITGLMLRGLTAGASILQGLNVQDLNDLGRVIDQNLKEIDLRIKRLGGRPVQDDCKLQPLRPDMAVQQLASGGMPGNCIGIESTTQVAVAVAAAAAPTDKLFGFEAANVDNVHKAKPQWFLDLMKNYQEQQNLGIGGEEVMLPFGESGPWVNGFFP